MEKNPETLSMDELRELAMENWDNGQTAPVEEQPATKQPVVAKKEDSQPVEEVDDVVYRKTIDLGDGSGVQVFEAPSMEELIDKLASAQEHATRKIREQQQQLKDREQKPAPKPMTEEEKFLLQQRMLNDPDAVINERLDKQFKEKYGERIANLEAAEKAREGTQTALDWMASNPDYHACDKNGQRMEKWLNLNGLDATPENLTAAFQDLSESGLLVPKPTETPAGTEAAKETTTRIVESSPATTTVRRKVVGEVSTKRQATVEKPAPGLTEAELYKMPMNQLEELMYRDFQ